MHRIRQIGEVGRDIRNQTRQQRAGPHDLRACLRGRRGAQVPPDRVDERLIGHHVLLVAAPGQNGGAFGVEHACEFDREPGLAHARVAADQHDPPVVGRDRVCPPRTERVELCFAAHERSVGDEDGRKRQFAEELLRQSEMPRTTRTV